MAAHAVAPSSCIKLHIPKVHVSERIHVPGSLRMRIAQRKSRGSCNVSWLSTCRLCKLVEPSVLNGKASSCFRKASLRCTCFSSFTDLDGVAASEWVPLGNQVLLMASIFVTYMAGVIPIRKSSHSPRKNISKKNLDIGSPASSGSARENVFKDNRKGAWAVVKEKILDSIDATESWGSRVLKSEQPRGKAPLSLHAISEGPKLWLLWTCFQQLKEEANNVSDTITMDDWTTIFPEIIRRSCRPACIAWLQQGFHQENSNSGEPIASVMIGKLNEDDAILQKIRKLGKEELYAEFMYFHKFGTHRKPSCYDSSLFQSHGVSILEDLVITLADGISSVYLELISVDGNLSTETSSRGLDICNLSSRALQKLRNEVALYQWLYQNLESVVSMYEDRFDLHTLENLIVETPGRDGTESHSWWKRLTLGKSDSVMSPLRYSVISHFSMPVKRTKELRALTGWRYYFSLFLELSDIGMPIIRVVLDKISGAISFFLVTLIGRSLGLIYSGIRQSLRWK